ncbi:ubiquinone biosynthesis accessory factor UbiJ [Coralloluteibacterium stylophorae]|uniref:Ubiquinone biosynthesis accessory factor UbiJ n=1 Tax=Coralloluteibacterium stylophorae TaxID=1776034 RepID=A0A8J7VRF7_9GAMM|nr:SCP2 sterol-binding domain-containing protein [Coralloluteibacterium stylophorae]MBS7457458.1 SCP2 sterol-binding domain-containing protein [Coralloluteibacterium stylophorae]
MTSRLPFLPNWKPLAGRALEAALDRVIALDPDTRAALARLDGRRITLHLASPPLALALTVRGGRLVVGPVREDEAEPDLSVRATLAGMVARLGGRAGDAGDARHRVRISGDADLARRLQRLAEQFDPDWERPLTAAFGEVLGHQLARGIAMALRGGLRTAKTLARDGAEFLTEESRDVVAKAEVGAFNDDVDALRERVDRLEARLARLRARAPGGMQ